MSKKKKPKVYGLDKFTMREAVNARLKGLGVGRGCERSIAQFAHSDACKATASTIYRFLSGNRSTLSSNVEEILYSVGLRLVETPRAPAWSRRK